jgi:hypothetical protein
MSEQKTYTLEEARRELARRECEHHGHSWDVISTIGAGPEAVVCTQCGWAGTVAMGKAP